MVNTYMLAFSGGFGNALLAMDWRAYDQVEGKGDGKGDIPKIYPPNVLRPDLGKIIAFSALIYFIGQLPSPSHPTAFLHAYPHIVWINFCCICQQQRSVAHCKWQISSSMIAMTFSVASECRAIITRASTLLASISDITPVRESGGHCVLPVAISVTAHVIWLESERRSYRSTYMPVHLAPQDLLPVD